MAKKSIKIYYEYYKNNKSNKVIVISRGFCECIEKYKELITSFFNEGYSVYILEHRGYGRSGCLSTVDKTQVSVDRFDYYVNDLKTFLDTILIPQNNCPLYLFAHSMGWGIGALFLERYPNYFKKAILNAL